MLIYNVYGETIQEARDVAAMVQNILNQAPGSAFAVPTVITGEVRRALGTSRYPAIMKNRIILWEGSSLSKATVLQWIEDNRKDSND